MHASQPRSWGLGAAALAVGFLMTGPPAPARAHWMGEAFNQGLIRAVNQVLDLMAMADAQGRQAPGLDRAVQHLMQAMANQMQGNGGCRGPQGGRGGIGGFAEPRGGGAGHGNGGPNIHVNNGNQRGGFCAGMAEAGGGHPDHHPPHHGPGHRHGDANVVQINGDNNIVVAGNRGNVRLNVDGAAQLNAGGRNHGGGFNVGLVQAGECGRRQREGRNLMPQPKPGLNVGGLAGNRNRGGPDMPRGARGPAKPAANQPNNQNANNLVAANGGRQGGAAGNHLAGKPVGGRLAGAQVGNRQPRQPGANAGGNHVGDRVGMQQPNRNAAPRVAAPMAGNLGGGNRAGVQVGNRNAAVVNRNAPRRGGAPQGGNKPALQAGGNRALAPRVGAPMGGGLAGGGRAGAQIGNRNGGNAKPAPVPNKAPAPRVAGPIGGGNLAPAPHRGAPLPAGKAGPRK